MDDARRPPTTCSSAATSCSTAGHHAQAAIVLERADRLEPARLDPRGARPGVLQLRPARARAGDVRGAARGRPVRPLRATSRSARASSGSAAATRRGPHLRLAVALSPGTDALPRRARAAGTRTRADGPSRTRVAPRACRARSGSPRSRASQNSPTIDFASTISPRSAAARASRQGTRSSSEPLVLVGPEPPVLGGGPQVRGEVQVHQLLGEARGREERCRAAARSRPAARSPPRARAGRRARGPPSCRRRRRRGRRPGSRAGSAPPASRNWRTSRMRSSSSMATIATAPGWPAMSRSEREPSARSMVSTRNVRYRPWWRTRESTTCSTRSAPEGSSGAVWGRVVRVGRQLATAVVSSAALLTDLVGRCGRLRLDDRRGRVLGRDEVRRHRHAGLGVEQVDLRERQDEARRCRPGGRDARSRRSRRCPCRRR